MVSAIILAAGQGRRFGSAKPLATLGDKPLVRHVLDAMAGAGIGEVIVVVPSRAAFADALAGAHTPLRIVVNDRPGDGMSESLRAGVTALDPRTQAVLVALADQPTLQGDVVQSIIRAWRGGAGLVVAPLYRGERGHPVLFDRVVIPELLTVAGDRGAREIVERDATRVAHVDVDAALPRDVDTPDDLAALDRALRLAQP